MIQRVLAKITSYYSVSLEEIINFKETLVWKKSSNICSKKLLFTVEINILILIREESFWSSVWPLQVLKRALECYPSLPDNLRHILSWVKQPGFSKSNKGCRLGSEGHSSVNDNIKVIYFFLFKLLLFPRKSEMSLYFENSMLSLQ